MFKESTQVIVFGTLLGFAVELYERREGEPHLPDHIAVPSPLLNAPTIVASGNIATPHALPSGSSLGSM
jgi:hypothetical protein